ncbi:MAG: hypothetical protein ACWGOY_15845 [Anaerolineales bacterium]
MVSGHHILQEIFLIGTRFDQIFWKAFGKAHMKRIVIMAIIKMLGEAIFFSMIAGIVIGIIGYVKKWDTTIAYSDAFFIAGCFLIVAGASSRIGAGGDWNKFQLLHSESFRDMNRGEQANFIVNASSSYHLLILGLLSGIILILISVFATKMY